MSDTERLEAVLLDVVTAAMCSAVMETIEDREGIMRRLRANGPSASFADAMQPSAANFLTYRASFADQIRAAVLGVPTSPKEQEQA